MTTEIEVLKNEADAIAEELQILRDRVRSKHKQLLYKHVKIRQLQNDNIKLIPKRNYGNSSLDNLIADEGVF